MTPADPPVPAPPAATFTADTRPWPAATLLMAACAAVGGAVLVALGMAGCAAVQPARMALPAGLAASAEQLPVQGLGGQRRGEFTLGPARGRYERRADELSLFGTLSTRRGGARYSLQQPGLADTEGQCQQRETSVQAGVLGGVLGGVLAVPLQPYAVNCQWQGGARLTLEAEPRTARTQEGRRGSYEAAGVLLQLQSVHTLQGSALPLAQPAGYTLSHQGVVVGAIDLSDSTRPRLWRPPAGQPLHQAVTQAALALALLWEPASGV